MIILNSQQIFFSNGLIVASFLTCDTIIGGCDFTARNVLILSGADIHLFEDSLLADSATTDRIGSDISLITPPSQEFAAQIVPP
jgi:hypothetical protein